ncbi:MAG: type II toxin-antitoxin system VapC family toxin [Pseudomonadota bacterium]
MFLLDTNVVSELRKGPKADKAVMANMANKDPHTLFLSVISVLELEIGVKRIERRDKDQGRRLRSWLTAQVKQTFAQRILPFETQTAEICAGFHVPDPRPERDAMIAATARQYGLTVLTRNVSDFEALDVPISNPWIYEGDA